MPDIDSKKNADLAGCISFGSVAYFFRDLDGNVDYEDRTCHVAKLDTSKPELYGWQEIAILQGVFKN